MAWRGPGERQKNTWNPRASPVPAGHGVCRDSISAAPEQPAPPAWLARVVGGLVIATIGSALLCHEKPPGHWLMKVGPTAAASPMNASVAHAAGLPGRHELGPAWMNGVLITAICVHHVD